MSSRDDYREHGAAIAPNPLREWAWGALGTLAVIGLLALGYALDHAPGDEPEDPDVAYARGVEEGRRQQQEFYAAGGPATARARCTAGTQP